MEKHSCCFFGHSNTPESIGNELMLAIIDLIENQEMKYFYVGTHGNFDKLVYGKLCEARKIYPFVVIYVVVPGLDYKSIYPYEDCIIPDGFETVPHRFLINHRNKWMLNKCEYVISYIEHSFGGAAKFVAMAERKNKKIINLYVELEEETE